MRPTTVTLPCQRHLTEELRSIKVAGLQRPPSETREVGTEEATTQVVNVPPPPVRCVGTTISVVVASAVAVVAVAVAVVVAIIHEGGMTVV